ncbi:AIPR family protein [Candidatus Woesearchaeota archaeon]|nr:AIPR family protein [Candidatus Woesearchaeota archaeon]
MITKITQESINKTFNKYSRQFEGVKEDYFGLLFISNKFKMPLEETSTHIAFGGNDYGIDAFYFDEEKRNLYLYQFKWSVDHMLFKDSFKRLINKGIEIIFGSSFQDRHQNQVIVKLKSSIQENKDVINRVFIHFVFKGDIKKAEQSTVLSSLREDLETKFDYRLKNFFNRDIDFIFQYISNEKNIGTDVQIKKHSKYEIVFEQCLDFSSGENRLMIVFIPITKILQMYNDLREKFFDKNIRSGLGEGKATNKEIKRSLKKIIADEEPSENFTFYHNGISLTTKEEMTIDEIEKKITMIEPRILNGAQTVKILHQFVEDNKTDERLIEKLSLIKVLARVIKSPDDKFLTQVTINNNRQNPIRPWNLRANDEVQLMWEDRFRESLGLYYERRENAFENMSDEELEELGIMEYDAIEVTHFAKTLLAWQGETDKMSRISEIFENENYYKETFRDRYFDVDIRKLILFYKIGRKLTAIKNEILRKGYNKYDYLKHATNLIWALLVQGLLNDDELDKYLEKYGNSLGVEGEYNKILKDIASRKIRTIFGNTFTKRKYEEYLNDKKYSFLRSKSTYDECMENARKLYRWDKSNY